MPKPASQKMTPYLITDIFITACPCGSIRDIDEYQRMTKAEMIEHIDPRPGTRGEWLCNNLHLIDWDFVKRDMYIRAQKFYDDMLDAPRCSGSNDSDY